MSDEIRKLAELLEGIDIHDQPRQEHRQQLKAHMLSLYARLHDEDGHSDGDLAETLATMDTHDQPRESYRQQLKVWVLSLHARMHGDGDLTEKMAAMEIPDQPRPEHAARLRRHVLLVYERTARPKAAVAKRVLPMGWLAGRGLKLASAACVFLAVGLGMLLLSNGTSTSFADVLEQIRNARNVSYTITFERGDNPPEGARCIFSEPGLSRITEDNGKVQIADYRLGKLLMLGAKEKIAILRTNSDKLSEKQWDPLTALPYLNSPTGKYIGREQLDDNTVNVFRLESESETSTVWADSSTNLPVKLQIVKLQNGGDSQNVPKAVITITGIVWNQELDDSLFSFELPEGYLWEEDFYPPISEEDFVRTLQTYAELNGDLFPKEFTRQQLTAIFQLDVGRKATVTVPHGGGVTTSHSEPTPEDKQIIRDGMAAIRFVSRMKKEGEWTYCGDSVRIGDADRAVCWWRQAGAETYRVVFGDLSVRSLTPAELAQLQSDIEDLPTSLPGQ